MNATAIEIKTKDGTAPCHFFAPPRRLKGGPRRFFTWMPSASAPRCCDMAQRVASHGYNVLLPDLYYRGGPSKPFEAASAFKEGPERDRLMGLMRMLNQKAVMEDTASFLDFLEQQPSFTGKVGCVGYCMGGGFALSAAGTFPERIAAAASLHGARLATDQPDSPHLLAPQKCMPRFTSASPALIRISHPRKKIASKPPSNPPA